MSLQLYNTFSKKKEIFTPIEKGRVKMYVCGPTVYDYAHIGNLSSFLTADILRRYLEYLGFEVRQIKNITDVGHMVGDVEEGEDKMEKASRREKKTPEEVAEYYTAAYLRDEKKLNILPPHYRPRPSKEIEAIIKAVQELIDKGYAYETEDGIYFSVKRFPQYGRLSGNTLENLNAGQRVAVNENKKDPFDFALWIKITEKNKGHLMHWNSPWGEGFPGWHIECSVMANKYLGPTIDIHTGGEDNIFPHHECEIAQSEALNEKPFVKYWVHTRFFEIDGEKMAKSKGNFYVLSKTPEGQYPSLEEKGFAPLVFRTLKLQSHYRSRANISDESLKQAQVTWEKINQFYLKAKELKDDGKGTEINLVSYMQQFQEAMNDDLNTPLALTVVLELIKEVNGLTNKGEALKNATALVRFLEEVDSVFAILDEKYFIGKEANIPQEVTTIAEERQKARLNKNFASADDLRKRIEELGYSIEDEKEGYKISKK